MKNIISAALCIIVSLFILAISIFTPSCKKDDKTKPEVKGDTIFFTIEGVEVSNGQVTSLGYNTVNFQGNFKKLQASTFKIVDYGYVLSSTTNEPTIEDNEGISHEGLRTMVGTFNSKISGLTENRTYYARVYLKREINSTGNIEYGYHPFSISFKTKPGTPPLLTNLNVTNITTSSFEVNSLIQDTNLLVISHYGHVWSKDNPNPNINNNDDMIDYGGLQSVYSHQFYSNITDLTPYLSYYVRAFATNQFGTGYSSVWTVSTGTPVTASFNFSPNTNLETGTLINFSNLSSANAVNFFWDFGDSTYSTDKNPQKTYGWFGEYQVKLVASDVSGTSKDSTFMTLYVFDDDIFFLPDHDIIADVTSVYFATPNDGSNVEWDFGDGEGTSNQNPVNYTFNSEGDKTVTVVKTSLGGQVTASKQIKVWATGPCHNGDLPNNHSITNIQFINNNGLLQTGTIKVNHNYGGSAYIYLYHPGDWSNGVYTPWGGYYFEVFNGLSNTFWTGSPSNPVYLGGDWGIKIMFTNGVESCVRTLRDVGEWNNNEFIVLSSKIFEGQ